MSNVIVYVECWGPLGGRGEGSQLSSAPRPLLNETLLTITEYVIVTKQGIGQAKRAPLLVIFMQKVALQIIC